MYPVQVQEFARCVFDPGSASDDRSVYLSRGMDRGSVGPWVEADLLLRPLLVGDGARKVIVCVCVCVCVWSPVGLIFTERYIDHPNPPYSPSPALILRPPGVPLLSLITSVCRRQSPPYRSRGCTVQHDRVELLCRDGKNSFCLDSGENWVSPRGRRDDMPPPADGS